MSVYFRRQDLPELAGLDDAEASRRLREAQDKLGLKVALLCSLVFGGLTVLGLFAGRALGYQLYGVVVGWSLGMGAYALIRLNAARALLEPPPTHDRGR